MLKVFEFIRRKGRLDMLHGVGALADIRLLLTSLNGRRIKGSFGSG